jgi:hypothetical protein
MTTYTITAEEIAAHRPDVLLPPDPEFAEDYARLVGEGRRIAARKTVAMVAICRNAMPWLPQTLALVEETGAMFKSWSCYIHENDSTDGTKDVLAAWHRWPQCFARLENNGRPHLSHTIATERTHALAEYRAACQEWVRYSTNPRPDYVIVFDTDPFGGWSVDGVATSVAHMERSDWWGLGSYSWCELQTGDGTIIPAHYDGFAFRWFGWQHRTPLDWFHLMRPVVGAPPVQVNSAFGQLAVYRSDAYFRGVYTGETCEHVPFHKSIAKRWPGRFGLNPSSRCVSFWTPRDARQHGGS